MNFNLPALSATSPAPTVSDRYRFISTREYLDALEDRGWSIAYASQVNSRKRSPEHAKHLVTLRHRDLAARRPDLGSVIPQINLLNSHDGSSRVRFIYGVMRLICSNGLMVGSQLEGVTFRHTASALEVAQVLTDDFFARVGKIESSIERWADTDLSPEQALDLATKARNLRFGDNSPVDPSSLLVSRRAADEGPSLWNTFNRLQESCSVGGVRFDGMRRRSRPLSNVSKVVEFNSALWDEAAALAN